jgi:hypothetical protein
MKRILTTLEEVERAVHSGKTVYYKDKATTVVYTTNTLKKRTSNGDEKYKLEPLARDIAELGLMNNFYVEEPMVIDNPWYQIIFDAAMRGSFLEDDYQRARFWQSGPCAKSSQRVRFVKGTYLPEDSILEKLEREFTCAVNRDQMTKSAKILINIEKRISEL